MRFGEDIGIDAERDAGGPFELCRALGEQGKLAFAFHIKKQDSGAQREVDFRRGLADSREDDAGGGGPAYSEDALEFSSRYDVESCSGVVKELEDGEGRVGLYGIADEVALSGEDFGEEAQAIKDVIGGIDVERRSILLRERVERDASAGERGVFGGINEGSDR